MRYCRKCVMPDTRPGILFNEEGICYACLAEERKNHTDWDSRWHELETLCDRHRRRYGKHAPDCVIAVSGGKDSHFQVHILKEKLGMNPLLVSVEDNFTMTAAGAHNLRNISETFGCQIISLKPDLQAQKKFMRHCFEQWGKPTWYIDRLIYTYPLWMARNLGISLLVYGENINYEYGGLQTQETPSAAAQLDNGVVSEVPDEIGKDCGVGEENLYLCRTPPATEGLEPIYLSYFVRWNSYGNYIFAKSVGFQDLTHEWRREHTPEWFDQIDSLGYVVHPWLKYPKFGHASATDYASKFIRYGLITREQGVELVKKHDHRVDQRAVQDFCNTAGYSLREFYAIVDRFYNRELFEKDAFGRWILKHPVWEEKSL